MNPVLILSTFHRQLTRPLSLVAIAGYAFFTLFASEAFYSSYNSEANLVAYGCFPLVWILGTGLIGNDVSTGSLALLLARPVSRGEYLFSRWLGLVSAVLFVHVTLVVMMTFLHGLSGSPGNLNLDGLGSSLLCAFLLTVTSSALLTLLSSLLPGHGDTGAFLGTYVLQGFLIVCVHDHALEKVIMQASTFILLPGALAIEQMRHASLEQSLLAFAVYLCIAAAELWVAWQYLEHRDLSYVNR